MKKIIKVLKHPNLILIKILRSKMLRILPDELFVRFEYNLVTGKRLNLTNPQRFNEKLQWLKLYDRNSFYTKLVDKFEVREYIADTIGEEYLIPLLGVYDSYEDINFDKLPDQFVLKPNHTSGNVFICTDKNKINHKLLRKKIKKWLKRNYFWEHREWPYKNVNPKIICEKYMVDESGVELKDYKFFCSQGVVNSLFIAVDRPYETKFNFYDTDFNRLPVSQHYPNFKKNIKKPKSFDKMIELSRVLSAGIAHVRVDFYNINGKIYFGEMTFYHFSGLEVFTPDDWDLKFGQTIKLHQN